MGHFDDIILKTAITDEADRATLQALVEKNPTLRTAIDDPAEKLDTWHKWKADNWNEEAGTVRQHVATISELAAAKNRIEALERAGIGGEVFKFEDIEADLTKRGYVKKDELDPMVVGRVNQSAAGIERFYIDTGSIPVEHFQEFGKVDPALMSNIVKQYAEEIKTNPNADPRAIYNRMVEPERIKIREAKAADDAVLRAKEIADAREAGRLEALKEHGMAPGNPGMPVDDSGSPGMDVRSRRIASAEGSGQARTVEALKAPLGSAASVNAGLEWLKEHRASSVQ